MMGNRSHLRVKRRRLFELQERHCVFCGRLCRMPTKQDSRSPDVFTLAKLDPAKTYAWSNVAGACFLCGSRRDAEYRKGLNLG